jgi:hypothetical protein
MYSAARATVTASLSEEIHTRFKTTDARRATLGSGSVPPTSLEETSMPKFVIEREIPGAGKLSPRDLKAISKKSCGVLSSLGPSVQWIESYVTADKIYCVYIAADESLVRRHAELGGFPANKISAVATVIDPTTAE